MADLTGGLLSERVTDDVKVRGDVGNTFVNNAPGEAIQAIGGAVARAGISSTDSVVKAYSDRVSFLQDRFSNKQINFSTLKMLSSAAQNTAISSVPHKAGEISKIGNTVLGFSPSAEIVKEDIARGDAALRNELTTTIEQQNIGKLLLPGGTIEDQQAAGAAQQATALATQTELNALALTIRRNDARPASEKQLEDNSKFILKAAASHPFYDKAAAAGDTVLMMKQGREMLQRAEAASLAEAAQKRWKSVEDMDNVSRKQKVDVQEESIAATATAVAINIQSFNTNFLPMITQISEEAVVNGLDDVARLDSLSNAVNLWERNTSNAISTANAGYTLAGANTQRTASLAQVKNTADNMRELLKAPVENLKRSTDILQQRFNLTVADSNTTFAHLSAAFGPRGAATIISQVIVGNTGLQTALEGDITNLLQGNTSPEHFNALSTFLENVDASYLKEDAATLSQRVQESANLLDGFMKDSQNMGNMEKKRAAQSLYALESAALRSTDINDAASFLDRSADPRLRIMLDDIFGKATESNEAQLIADRAKAVAVKYATNTSLRLGGNESVAYNPSTQAFEPIITEAELQGENITGDEVLLGSTDGNVQLNARREVADNMNKALATLVNFKDFEDTFKGKGFTDSQMGSLFAKALGYVPVGNQDFDIPDDKDGAKFEFEIIQEAQATTERLTTELITKTTEAVKSAASAFNPKTGKFE